ncbi:AbrB/MazE/SpoVT family DNA-binding domain-containing protein [Methanoculleus sediminis]|uniref:AbrB/MazE/SpoVT family DNA-binding domain-containing protein n=1 Tax=Methanoculleus sediminis TaxID=1550566 RepID=UPI0012E01F0D|nr:AbrB/MazE/SpoVT family DNA-binding domain-containing protein [Methanoculleus sediminis]
MARNPRANETTITVAASNSNSLRATIPAFIKDQFELEKGDRLRWSINRDRLVIEIIKQEGGK